jgi:ABC-type Fe3+-siderophore transport system permease subunit
MKNILVKIAALIAAVILLQTLYFKFTAQPESIYIFSKLGIEPYGRIGSGIFELITSILILLPKTRVHGSVLGIGVISGAILSHLFVLGIEVQNDGGTLFLLALAVFFCCLYILIVERDIVMGLVKQFLLRKA